MGCVRAACRAIWQATHPNPWEASENRLAASRPAVHLRRVAGRNRTTPGLPPRLGASHEATASLLIRKPRHQALTRAAIRQRQARAQPGRSVPASFAPVQLRRAESSRWQSCEQVRRTVVASIPAETCRPRATHGEFAGLDIVANLPLTGLHACVSYAGTDAAATERFRKCEPRLWHDGLPAS